jgi:SAM-dependent methyltransferase
LKEAGFEGTKSLQGFSLLWYARFIMESQQHQAWTAESVLALARSYQGAAILAAAAELDLFSVLGSAAQTSFELARKLQCDSRALAVLLNALAALGLVEKSGEAYAAPSGLDALLSTGSRRSVLAMAQHQANCLRNWTQLAWVVKRGRPAERVASIRGEARDQEAFIEAMHNVSAPNAEQVVQGLQSLCFRHLLDIGGASGTWTIAFLQAHPSAAATLFDLPHVIPLAERRLAAASLEARVRLVPGNFMTDALPPGADLAWLSAIVHQNSRVQNQALFVKVFRALAPGGRIAIRDIIMDETHTQPVAGALFAVNMLVATEGGGTFTFGELKEDLEKAGFTAAAVQAPDEGMNSVVVAEKSA